MLCHIQFKVHYFNQQKHCWNLTLYNMDFRIELSALIFMTHLCISPSKNFLNRKHAIVYVMIAI